MQQPHRSAFPILLAGLSGGAGLEIYVIIPRYRGLSLMIAVVVLLVLSGYLGYHATASTEKPGSGGRIGCQIGLIGAIVFIVMSVIYFLVNIGSMVRGPNSIGISSEWYFGFYCLALVFVAGVLCVVGLYGGALGGTIGKGRGSAQALPLQDQGATLISLPPNLPQDFAPPPQDTLQGYIPLSYPPPGTSASIPSQRTAPLPSLSRAKRLKRWYSPAVLVLWIPLILILLGGGSAGFYQTITGRWPLIPGPTLTAIAWSGKQFVAVGSSGTILISPDGQTWTSQPSVTLQDLYSIAWSGTQFVIVGGNGTILTSPDGQTWTVQNSGAYEDLYGVAWSGKQYATVGYLTLNPLAGTILTSPDGHSWTIGHFRDVDFNGTAPVFYGPTAIAWSGTQFMVVGDSGTQTSSDGRTWKLQDSGTSLTAIAWSGTQFVVVGDHGVILTSSDGRTWTLQDSGTSQELKGVTWSGTQFVAVGATQARSGGVILTSLDGQTWTTQNSGTSQNLYDIGWSGKQFVAVGNDGTILTSPDGQIWRAQHYDTSLGLPVIA